MFYLLHRLRKYVTRRHPTIAMLAAMTAFVCGYGTVGFHFLEGYPWGESLYWTVTTMSTVGYGDFSPTTSWGRIHAMTVMVLGIGIFGLVLESLVSVLLNASEKRKRGMITIKDRGHILICGWSETVREAIQELQHLHQEVYLLHDSLEVRDMVEQMEAEVTFIKGDPTRWEDLQRAGADVAGMLIIDLPTDSESLDCLITVRRRTQARVVVEVERAENREKFRAAGADEVTIPFVLSGRLIAQSYSKRFLARFVTEVLSTDIGINLEEIEVEAGAPYVGKRIKELAGDEFLPDMYIVAVGREEHLLLDTSGGVTIQPGDRLICLKNGRQETP